MTEHSRVTDPNHYDPDEDARPRDSEDLKPFMPNTNPTPSPELSEAEDSSSDDDNEAHKTSRRAPQVASQGDAVLIGLLGGGKAQDVARHAAKELIQSDNEMDHDMSSPGSSAGAEVTVMEREEPSTSGTSAFDFVALAAGALKAAHAAQTISTSPEASLATDTHSEPVPLTNGQTNHHGAHESQYILKTEPVDDASLPSPMTTVNGGNELAPIQEHSPKMEDRNGMTLPSISSQLGIANIAELKSIAEAASAKSENDTNGSHLHRHSFSSAASPPRPPLFTIQGVGASSHVSPPPLSPNETYHRSSLHSPARPAPTNNSYYASYASRAPLSSDGPHYGSSNLPTPGDYNSSSTETPHTDQSGATPAMPHGMDRMSIDNMTNPQIGGFQCTYPGCGAQPFQTQYLLNSHANVHSSNRPHYCPVKGCPRSEGGKGFKRKNEMIRHGLVHESPGYVCPYCNDREHKYPRPDNLQRHVRVHHVDKDKDDPVLRDVLAQRPEGPSRGRRRRGGTNI